MICQKEFALKELESTTLKLANYVERQLKSKPALKSPKRKVRRALREGAREIPEKGIEYDKVPSAISEGKIAVPETVLQNIQDLVSKLKI